MASFQAEEINLKFPKNIDFLIVSTYAIIIHLALAC